MSDNLGNSVVVYNYKLVKLLDKFEKIDFTKHINLYGDYVQKFNYLTSRLGLSIEITNTSAVKKAKIHSTQILMNILDNIPNDLTLRECMELLIVDLYFDIPTEKNNNKLAINDLGLTYILQEANAIIGNLKGNNDYNAVSNAFNYLDLVDGNYLGTNHPDALYFNTNHKLATVGDLRKEYLHAIKVIQDVLVHKNALV